MHRTSLWFLFTASSVLAQTVPDASRTVAVHIDSGFVGNDSVEPAMAGTGAVVFSTLVHVPSASWLRLSYGGSALAGDLDSGDGSYLRITSLLDGAVQTQHEVHVAQWRETSAYFNGDAVRVEIVAFPGTGENRIVIDEVTAGEPAVATESICGANDDRTLSSDPRMGRNQPAGCTSWMIDDCNKCFLTAGHCTSNFQVVEFNVPLSSATGALQHPPPSDQYAVDAASMQSNGGQGIGDDWAYFGVFPNSTTGMHPFAANGGQAFTLVTPPAVAGQSIRITGYGSVGPAVSPTWHQVQKTHVGPYVDFTGRTLRYATDTTGGNSGSPIVVESTGEAIGIHTHAGCTANPLTANQGTASIHSELQRALKNGSGVCLVTPTFAFPNGLPTLIDPAGTTVRVTVSASACSAPVDGTGMLHVDTGSGFQPVPMQQVSPGVYDAVFPTLPCVAPVSYYFSSTDASSAVLTSPKLAPASHYSALVVADKTDIAAFDFNTLPLNWFVQNAGPTNGAWDRGVPTGDGRGLDPVADFDGSGSCWVTGLRRGEDLDGGPTVLTTATYDLSGAFQPFVRYARWMRSDGDDRLVVEVDDGSGWQQLESIGDTSGWVDRVVPLDFLTSRTAVQFRFVVADQPNDSTTEAAIDGFQVFDGLCFPPSFRTIGTGCAGTAGTPELDIAPGDRPIAGASYDVVLTNLPAGGAAVGIFGFSDTRFPPWQLPLDLAFVGMPDCLLYTNIFTALSLTMNGGQATWTFAIPADPAAFGVRLFQQGFILDQGANALGATVTNAGEVIIGG